MGDVKRSLTSCQVRVEGALLGGPAVAPGTRFFHPERLARRDHDDSVVKEPIEKRGCRRLQRQEGAPLLKRPVAGYTQAAVLVVSGNEAEERLRARRHG